MRVTMILPALTEATTAAAYRSQGVHVAMSGLHVTSLPDEAGMHADVFVGPGEDTWPVFLDDLRRGQPRAR